MDENRNPTEPAQQVNPEAGEFADMMAAASAAIDKLKADYMGWLRGDLAKMRDCLADAAAEPQNSREHLERLYAVCHDVKGQGGSFGFDMITDIGQSLCEFLKSDRAGSAAGLTAIEAHISAIETVADEGLEGDGGSAGTALIQELTELLGRAGADENPT